MCSGVKSPSVRLSQKKIHFLDKNIKFQVAYEETPIIDALHKFVYKRVSALPIVDSEVSCPGVQCACYKVVHFKDFHFFKFLKS